MDVDFHQIPFTYWDHACSRNVWSTSHGPQSSVGSDLPWPTPVIFPEMLCSCLRRASSALKWTHFPLSPHRASHLQRMTGRSWHLNTLVSPLDGDTSEVCVSYNFFSFFIAWNSGCHTETWFDNTPCLLYLTSSSSTHGSGTSQINQFHGNPGLTVCSGD